MSDRTELNSVSALKLGNGQHPEAEDVAGLGPAETVDFNGGTRKSKYGHCQNDERKDSSKSLRCIHILLLMTALCVALVLTIPLIVVHLPTPDPKHVSMAVT